MLGFNSIPVIPNLGGCLMPNFSLLLSLEPFEKFLWWMGGGGGGWCLNVDIVIGFVPNLALALWPRAKPINST